MDQLRSEIVESQKARTDFLRWKLVIVAALGAVGLGLSGSHGPFVLVLLAIPLVCFYVDLLCNHINLRIQVIGAFIRLHQSEPQDKTLHDYELYVNGQRRAFELENGALKWSTWALSAAVGFYGLFLATVGKDLTEGIPLAGSGMLGFGLSALVSWMYNDRLQHIVGHQRITDQKKPGVRPGERHHP